MKFFLWSLSSGTVLAQQAICDSRLGETACGTLCCASYQHCESTFSAQGRAINSTGTTPTATVKNQEAFTTTMTINVQRKCF